MAEPMHILFIEDNPADVELAARRLRKDGVAFVFEIVDSPATLIEALSTFRPDVVISDYAMPEFDGMDALRIALQHAPETPFIMLTGSVNEETAVECLNAGADDYVLKGNLARLAPAVLSALEKRHTRRERQRAVEALRTSEERFRAMIENSSDGVALVGADGTLEYSSPSATRVLGYPPASITGSNAFELIHPEDLESVKQLLGELAAAPGAARTAVFRARHTDGSWRWIETTARNAFSEPAVRAIVLNFRDITEQRQTSEALRRSEEKYRLIADSTSDGIFTLDLNGRFTYVSPRWLVLRGLSEQEVIGRHFSDVVLGEADRSRTREMFARGLAGESAPLHEVDVVTSEGRVISIELSTSNLYGPHGELTGRVGVFRDITERRQADQAVRRLAAAVEQAAESIVITDVDGSIQYVNPAFERITGYTKEEAIGRKPSMLKSGEQDQDFYRALWECIKRGETWQGRFRNRRKDGTLYEEDATISPIRNDSGAITSFVAVKRDITQEMALEMQLRQAQKMEAVGNLAGGVAHDFNNLLQALVSQVQVLRRQRHDPLKVDRVITALEDQVRRGASLTRQLLLFSRREVAKPELFDLNEVLRHTLKMLRHLVRENVALEAHLCSEPLMIKADHGEMEQVLMNLVVNAADAMPGGGRLEVSSSLHQPGQAGLTVKDSGHGIPEEIQKRIFEPFFTTKPPGRGTGLGLSVVHGIVMKSGGTIEVESDGKSGTTFRIALPLTSASGQKASEGKENALREGAGERILVVEDEESAREGLRDILISLNYQVTAVRTAEEADRLAAGPPFALLLSDVVLPGMSGLDLVSRLTKRWPELKVILMSGYADSHSIASLPGNRIRNFLQKPFDMSTLANEVHTALGK